MTAPADHDAARDGSACGATYKSPAVQCPGRGSIAPAPDEERRACDPGDVERDACLLSQMPQDLQLVGDPPSADVAGEIRQLIIDVRGDAMHSEPADSG